ncbi:MAG: 5'/3'-nucleotidase SurE [Treponema sp.]|nr:5'/3'-nucleotidase SurE [Treponema sp.]
MNILITNDDGYQSRGLRTLAEVLKEKHNVYVMAPDSNRSAASQCITMSRPLELVKIEENIYTCSGFPADCVINGVVSGVFPKIDVVISGINYGANIGTDIIYSGTCGAARQGSLYGIPSIAVSLEHPKAWEAKEEEYNFENLSRFILENLEKLVSLADTKPPYSFINVNGLSCDCYKGMKMVTDISVRDYGDQIQLEKTEKGYLSRFIMGRSSTSGSETCDYRISEDGYVAVAVMTTIPVCTAKPL